MTDDEILRYQDAWRKYWRQWMFVYWLLTVLICIGSAFLPNPLVSGIKDYIGLMVAAASALTATLNPRQRGEAFHSAWLVINIAKCNGSSLQQAYVDGENVIANRYYTGKTVETPAVKTPSGG